MGNPSFENKPDSPRKSRTTLPEPFEAAQPPAPAAGKRRKKTGELPDVHVSEHMVSGEFEAKPVPEPTSAREDTIILAKEDPEPDVQELGEEDLVVEEKPEVKKAKASPPPVPRREKKAVPGRRKPLPEGFKVVQPLILSDTMRATVLEAPKKAPEKYARKLREALGRETRVLGSIYEKSKIDHATLRERNAQHLEQVRARMVKENLSPEMVEVSYKTLRQELDKKLAAAEKKMRDAGAAYEAKYQEWEAAEQARRTEEESAAERTALKKTEELPMKLIEEAEQRERERARHEQEQEAQIEDLTDEAVALPPDEEEPYLEYQVAQAPSQEGVSDTAEKELETPDGPKGLQQDTAAEEQADDARAEEVWKKSHPLKGVVEQNLDVVQAKAYDARLEREAATKRDQRSMEEREERGTPDAFTAKEEAWFAQGEDASSAQALAERQQAEDDRRVADVRRSIRETIIDTDEELDAAAKQAEAMLAKGELSPAVFNANDYRYLLVEQARLDRELEQAGWWQARKLRKELRETQAALADYEQQIRSVHSERAADRAKARPEPAVRRHPHPAPPLETAPKKKGFFARLFGR